MLVSHSEGRCFTKDQDPNLLARDGSPLVHATNALHSDWHRSVPGAANPFCSNFIFSTCKPYRPRCQPSKSLAHYGPLGDVSARVSIFRDSAYGLLFLKQRSCVEERCHAELLLKATR